MKNTNKLIGWIVLGVVAATAASLVVELRRRHSLNRLSTAADEGYETAHDIIYPEKHSAPHNKKLRYGPVF
ncbi:hypothetical protein GCM10027051_04400 [Niabella terrae]